MEEIAEVKEILKDSENRMRKTIQTLAHEFLSVRTGRVSPALLENIKIDYYGTLTPLTHLATVTAPEPLLLVVQPWDRNIIKEIEKAILQSNLGVTPSNDGQVVRLPFPPLTEERRKEFVKMVSKMAEEARVAVRNIRREANEDLKSLKDEHKISEDEWHRRVEEVQKLTDKFIEEINTMLKKKESEILEV